MTTSSPCPICGSEGTTDPVLAPLLRCNSCSFLFLGPSAGAGPSYDDDYFENYDPGGYLAQEEQRRYESRRRLLWLTEHVLSPARVLEVGAAAGFFVHEALQRGYDAVGVEVNATMAQHARADIGVDVRTGRIEDAELGDSAFDAVCAWHVLEHLDEPASALSSLRQALRPGGVVLLEVPNVMSAVARRNGPAWPALDLPYHVGHYGPRSMRAVLERAGLGVVAIDTIPFAHYVGRGRLGSMVRTAHAFREVVRGRGPLALGTHPTEHQLLRAVARRPD